ncbi:hypothetical protein MARILYN_22 [Vibrio phage Marilyn]|nr:hypothetical protein MARILYN_22 [Vibrio phage Marilyn]WCD55545.1 hypothetical protein FAYDEN_22 [Vibrio phage Fayden]WCD55602.1 hypothetical protein BAYBAE_22 [Vibrio phage Baybae]WCD55661.1 hypothetical protein VAITEPHAGE_22 [Vibrio phage Vaitephage]
MDKTERAFATVIGVFIGLLLLIALKVLVEYQPNEFNACVEWQQGYVKRHYSDKGTTIQEIKLDDRVERFCALSK